MVAAGALNQEAFTILKEVFYSVNTFEGASALFVSAFEIYCFTFISEVADVGFVSEL